MGMIYTIIDKRGSGKSQLALELFKENLENNLLLLTTLVERQTLIKRKPELPMHNIYTLNSINASFGEKMFESIIVDQINNVSQFENTVQAIIKNYGMNGNIYIFTSPTESTQIEYYKENSNHTFSVQGFRDERRKEQSVYNFKKFYTDFSNEL